MSGVILYTSTNCPNCFQVKSFLEERGIEFEERNVNKKSEYAQEVRSMGMRAVPVTVIGEHRILGANKVMLEKALQKLG